MARCGCSGTSCSCLVVGDGSITVTGSGSGSSPYIVSGGGVLTVTDTPTVDLSLTGSGSAGSPYALSAAATVNVEDLANLDTSSLAAGHVPSFDGSAWVTIPAPSASPGSVIHDGTLTGDGSAGNPLKVASRATSTYTPAWTGTTTNPTLGSGQLTGRYVVDETGWVRISIQLVCASDTGKGSGAWRFSLPSGLDGMTGQAQTLKMLVLYPDGNARVGAALINGGSTMIERMYFTWPPAATGSYVVTGSSMSTWPSGGRLLVTGTYEVDV